MEVISTAAKIEPLSMEEKFTLLTKIKLAIDTMQLIMFKMGDVSYGCSIDEKYLVVSSAEMSDIPNASALPLLTEHIGEPEMTFVKRSLETSGLLMLYMIWNIRNVPVAWFESTDGLN